ncbi:MAG: hypothetical protein ACTSWY_11570 [Promethearchaeota archaeon]
MTEVVISEKTEKNTAAWYQLRLPVKAISVKNESIKSIFINSNSKNKPKSRFLKQKKSFWNRIKSLFAPKKIKEGDKIIPVMEIDKVKARAYSKIGYVNGATLSQFRIN